MAIRRSVSVLVLNEKGEILLTQRYDLKTWGFPGGMIEKGEEPEKTAKREVKEETGIKIKIMRLTAIYLNDHPLWKNIIFFFKAKKESGNLKRQEGETLKVSWVKKQDLPKFLSPRHYQRFLDATASSQEIKLRVERYFPLPLKKLPLFFWRRILGKGLGLVKM
ncbi:MAG: NUDIX domain-containing protein [Patescibacteria group bacterium]